MRLVNSAFAEVLADDSLTVPSVCVGTAFDIKRKLRKVLREVVHEGTWEPMMEPGMIHIEDAPREIMLDRKLKNARRYAVHLYLISNELSAVRAEYYGSLPEMQVSIDLFQRGVPYFWFCLYLITIGGCILSQSSDDAAIIRLRAMNIFSAIVQRWPVFCAISERFTSQAGYMASYPSWGPPPILFKWLGLEEFGISLQHHSPWVAGQLMENALRELRAREECAKATGVNGNAAG